MMGTPVGLNKTFALDFDGENDDKLNYDEPEDLDWSPDQEVLLLYSLHGLKPVGPHKHFRMLLIQERFSNAMNKYIPSSVIWKKLNSWYDMEALDEAEAEADAADSVEIDFELPWEEFGEIMEQKLKGHPVTVPKRNTEHDLGDNSDTDLQKEIQTESDTSSQDHKVVSSDGESSKESDMFKVITSPSKASGKEIPKRATKRTLTPVKDNVQQKKDGPKEVGKKDTPKREEPKKGQAKEEEKKDAAKKVSLDIKKDEKKDDGNKTSKKESINKKVPEQSKKEVEVKKTENKKTLESPKNQRETSKQPKADSVKRGETKLTRSEIPKQRAESKRDSSSDKKKEGDKKSDLRSPEKTPESSRGGKLRARKDADSEKMEAPSGTKRTKESKTADSPTDENLTKKSKTPVIKGRPTRNSLEPQKPASPASSPLKRRTRLL